MSTTRDILYLGADDLDALGLGMPEIVDILEDMFRLKATGETVNPPKIFFQFDDDRLYSAMASSCPPLGHAGCKWQSGDPANKDRGLPYIQGLYILNEHATGQMVAVINSEWITGRRTAAASALVARYQARAGASQLAILGCGLQGRMHLEILAHELTSLEICHVYDIDPKRQAAFVDEMDGRFGAIKLQGAASAEAACRPADVIITGGPITMERNATIAADWIKSGALVVTIDYDSYVTDQCIAAMDIVITDDRGQIEDARLHEGKFTGVQRVDADNSELIAKGTGRRTSDDQRILAFNLGIALEDVATAVEIDRRARALSIGTVLRP
jgi:ornithine cyclodeaminase/alanine dehydrogenase